VPHFPREDEKLRATSITRRRGGNGPNTLEVLQQLVKYQDQPIALSLCSVLPAAHSQDLHEIKSSLPDVDFSTCVFRPDHVDAASSYIIRSEETGSRTIVNYNELPEMTLEEFVDAVYNVTKTDECWFHFEVRVLSTCGDAFGLPCDPTSHPSRAGIQIQHLSVFSIFADICSALGSVWKSRSQAGQVYESLPLAPT
jgi:hypothetical protein